MSLLTVALPLFVLKVVAMSAFAWKVSCPSPSALSELAVSF
jgi:hypothetical protein